MGTHRYISATAAKLLYINMNLHACSRESVLPALLFIPSSRCRHTLYAVSLLRDAFGIASTRHRTTVNQAMSALIMATGRTNSSYA